MSCQVCFQNKLFFIFDGKTYSEFNNNKNAQNEINIKGGVGALNVSFK